MNKAIIFFIIILTLIVVVASVTLSVERKADIIPEKIAEKEVRSDLINLGAYALKWAIRQVHGEYITESNISVFDNEGGAYHFAFFDVPALDGSVDRITYRFGDIETLEGGEEFGEEEEEEEEVEQDIVTVPPLDMIFSHGAITLNGSARINGTTGTNSTAANSVNFAWSTLVDGDFYVGPGADYNTVIYSAGYGRTPEDNITGTISNLPSTRTYPLPTYPEFPSLTDQGSFTTPWTPSGVYLIDQDGYYTSIEATGGRTITINVGTGTRRIVVGSLSVGQGFITLQGTGNLILYVENSFSLTGSSIINTGGDASKVHMYYSGATDLDLAGSTTYNGSIYIESANIRIGGSGGITGHIICGGSRVDVNGAANAYVRALYAPNADASVTGSGSISGILIANTITVTGSGIITADNSWTIPVPGIDDEEVEEEETPVAGVSTVQVDISALVSEDEYGNENDRTSFATILVTYSGGEEELDVEEPESPALSMESDLNINPTNNSAKRFEMQTPSGQIDRGTLHSNGATYTYTGPASQITLRAKQHGNTITVNENDITLATNTTYTIQSDNMTVNLRNTHGSGNWNQSKGHWWIEITCTDPTITPDPGLPEPEEAEEELDIEEAGEVTIENIEILYWHP